MNFLKLKYEPNTKLQYMPDFVGRGRSADQKIRSASRVHLNWRWRKERKKRKWPDYDDGLGPNDVNFGFSVGDYDGEVEL